MNNFPTSQAENHSFNTAFAAMYGVHEAILIAHFQAWINHNMRLGKNFKDGRTWCYQTRQEIAAWFPYLSAKQVRRVTDSLVEQGVLIKGHYNKKKFDKTIWYAFKNEKMFTIAQMGTPIAQMGKPIPYTKTYPKCSKEHICPDGGDAPSSKEARNADFLPSLRGEALKTYKKLDETQQKSYEQLMKIEPAHKNDQRFNPVVALNLAKTKTATEISKGIRVYQQRLKRGERPRSMGAYLNKIIESGYEPEPEHVQENKQFWTTNAIYFPENVYKQHRDNILFFNDTKEISFRMNPQIFKEQIEIFLDRALDTEKL